MKNHKIYHPFLYLTLGIILLFLTACDSTNSTDPNQHANYKIIFSSARSLNSFDIYSMDIDGSNITQITQNGRNDYGPRISPNGMMIYYRSLWYDGSAFCNININGTNETIIHEIGESELFSNHYYTVSDEALVYAVRINSQTDLYSIQSDGSGNEQLTNDTRSESMPQFSHDCTKIIYESFSDIYIMNSDGTMPTMLTDQVYHQPSDGMFRFSFDDNEILFAARTGSVQDIYRLNVDGSNLTNLTNNSGNDAWPVYSHDESKIAFISTRDEEYDYGNGDIYIMSSDGSNQTRLTFHKMVEKQEILFTPDDEKIIFVSQKDNDSSADQIYSINIDGSNEIALTMSPGQNMSPQILVTD